MKKKAQERAAVILQVRAGKMTAKEGAKLLGISRKTYYQWEARGLEGMMEKLQEEEPGRPEKVKDPEKQQMETKIRELEAERDRFLQVEAMRKAWEIMKTVEAKKNRKSSSAR
jgi:transposase